MRNLILFALVALLIPSVALASTGTYRVLDHGTFVVYRIASTSTVAAAGIDTTTVQMKLGKLTEVDDDATTANLDLSVFLQNTTTSGGAADSMSVAIDTSLDGSTWEQQYAIANDNTCLNWGEIKALSITEPAPWYRFRVKNLHASVARTLVLRVAVPTNTN